MRRLFEISESLFFADFLGSFIWKRNLSGVILETHNFGYSLRFGRLWGLNPPHYSPLQRSLFKICPCNFKISACSTNLVKGISLPLVSSLNTYKIKHPERVVYYWDGFCFGSCQGVLALGALGWAHSQFTACQWLRHKNLPWLNTRYLTYPMYCVTRKWYELDPEHGRIEYRDKTMLKTAKHWVGHMPNLCLAVLQKIGTTL